MPGYRKRIDYLPCNPPSPPNWTITNPVHGYTFRYHTQPTFKAAPSVRQENRRNKPPFSELRRHLLHFSPPTVPAVTVPWYLYLELYLGHTGVGQRWPRETLSLGIGAWTVELSHFSQRCRQRQVTLPTRLYRSKYKLLKSVGEMWISTVNPKYRHLAPSTRSDVHLFPRPVRRCVRHHKKQNRVGRYRKRLDGAYAMQMRAMQRLHRRGNKS